MENQNSQPMLVPPTVPDNFDSIAGTSKRDYAIALFNLLKGSQIVGINPLSPVPYDLAALSTQVTQNTNAIKEIVVRTPTRITMAGIANGILVVPFPSVGTTDYQVDVAFVSPNTDLPDSLMWAIITGSKLPNQVQLRINGNAAAMDIEVTITPMSIP